MVDTLTATVSDSPDTLIAVVEESDRTLEADVGDAPETLIATVKEM